MNLTWPLGTFDYQRMPSGLCNAPFIFQRCVIAIFANYVDNFMEVFMDDFSIFGYALVCVLLICPLC